MRVGFIGLGNMGEPLAAFVRKAGFSLVVHDLRKEVAAPLLDAPLDGGREGALEGQLTLFVGGDEAVLRSVKPVLDTFSKSVVWVGELGTGSITKLVHNALAMSIDLLLAECLTLGAKAGVAVPGGARRRKAENLGGFAATARRSSPASWPCALRPAPDAPLACRDGQASTCPSSRSSGCCRAASCAWRSRERPSGRAASRRSRDRDCRRAPARRRIAHRSGDSPRRTASRPPRRGR